MAASIGSGVRVRINFDDSCRYVCESALHRTFWYLVNLDRLKTIEGLGAEICSRFDICSNLRVELSLDGCLLPQWETTAILRDNDLVSVAAVEEAVNKTTKSSRSDWEKSVTSESNRQNKKKRRASSEEQEENDLAPVVAVPKEKKSRNEVKSRVVVEADVAKCGGKDGFKEKRRNRWKQDTDILDLSDLPYDPNSMQSSTAVKSRSCLVSFSENLTHESNRLQAEQTGTDGVNRNEPTEGSPFLGASASALVEDESEFGKNVMVSNGVEEAKKQLTEEVGLAVEGLLGEVKKKAKRTRRSRKNRKENKSALLDPELKSSSNLLFPHTLELPSKGIQERSFQWQKPDSPWPKTSAYSLRQHMVFDDDDDLDSKAVDGQNISVDGVTDGLQNQNMAEGAERVPEGLIGCKGEVPRADKGLSSYELKRSCHPVEHHEEPVPELSEATSRSVAASLLESASVGGRGYSRQLMRTTSDSRDLSHEQKPRQIHSVADLSPFAHVQVFKRQRGAKLQSPSAAEPVLTSKVNQLQAPTCTKRQTAQDILNATTSENNKDYSMYELLLGPPRSGDVIAYKILQLSDDYSPVLSSYKEGKVLKFTSATRIVELEPKNLQIPSQVKKSTGRFDLTIEDDNEILTNSLMEDDKPISISWDLLVEPRLVV